MSADDRSRKPKFFSLDDARLAETDMAPLDEPVGPDLATKKNTGSPGPAAESLIRTRGIGWGGIFLSALGGLISIGLSIWVTAFIADLFARGGWLGTLALGLALVSAFAALVLIAREIAGFFRLARVAAIRLSAEDALANADKKRASQTSHQLERLFSSREELKWGAKRLGDHRREVLDARELLILTERELLKPLDAQARQLISVSARRVAMITAVSPSAIVDVAFVAIENLGMMRRLATLYGGRPGFFGSLRLARLVLGHLALTGSVALGDDVIQQLIGHGLTARLSARLGEGVMNGAFTGRIGIAAVNLCRPMPYIEADRPRLRDFVAELRSAGGSAPPVPAPGTKDE
jgi:putative membrane protein